MQVRLICKTDHKINAIKTLRTVLDIGLVDAKNIVERGMVLEAAQDAGQFLHTFKTVWNLADYYTVKPPLPTWEIEPYVSAVKRVSLNYEIAE